MKALIRESKTKKALLSKSYNYIFNKETGYFARWGQTKEEDPQWSPFGPEILDIEVTTKCAGPGGKLCPFCYKSNTPNGKNMTFETFKQILDKMPKTLTQVAFGADAHATSNPDLWKMMEYCRNNEHNQIVPNITVADITDDTADLLVHHCGAVAVSRYSNKNICYDSVKKLTDRGLKQTNIHMMISEETYAQAMETIQDKADGEERLKGLNAIVLLSLKKKGRGTGFTPLSQDKFNTLVSVAFHKEVPLGFDSCSAHKFLEAIKDHPDKERLTECVEPCESSAFSSYVDVNGNFNPCSFAPETDDWKEGLSVVDCKDFVKDIWYNPRVQSFRENLIACKRACPLFEV
jgi:hypothetical protein